MPKRRAVTEKEIEEGERAWLALLIRAALEAKRQSRERDAEEKREPDE